MLEITGNTYAVKEQLKQLGCKWNAEKKSWIAPDETVAAQARVLVGGTPTKNASHKSYSASPTKTCWECGRRFTYSDAKRGGGDWTDSYCGC